MLRNCNVCYYFWTIYHTSVVTVCCHVGTIFFFWKLISIPFPTKVLRMTRILKFFFPRSGNSLFFTFHSKWILKRLIWQWCYSRSCLSCDTSPTAVPFTIVEIKDNEYLHQGIHRSWRHGISRFLFPLLRPFKNSAVFAIRENRILHLI